MKAVMILRTASEKKIILLPFPMKQLIECRNNYSIGQFQDELS